MERRSWGHTSPAVRGSAGRNGWRTRDQEARLKPCSAPCIEETCDGLRIIDGRHPIRRYGVGSGFGCCSLPSRTGGSACRRRSGFRLHPPDPTGGPGVGMAFVAHNLRIVRRAASGPDNPDSFDPTGKCEPVAQAMARLADGAGGGAEFAGERSGNRTCGVPHSRFDRSMGSPT